MKLYFNSPPSSVVGWTPLIAINSQLDLSAYNSVKTKYTMSSDSNEKNTTYTKEQSNPVLPPEVEEIARMSSKLANPLAGLTTLELIDEAEEFCLKYSLMEHVHSFRRGAILAADPSDLDRLPEITDDERQWVSFESTRQWKQPMTMFYIAVISSMAAIVQGMDEAVVNGAQIFYYERFGIPSNGTSQRAVIQGLVNSAPYLCCSLFWLPSGKHSRIPGLNYSRLAYFLVLESGLCQRQLQFTLCLADLKFIDQWTAFGIALGDIVSVIFVDISPDLAWRLMLGSTAVAPMLVCMMIFPAPESPRWYMSRGRIADAYKSMCRLRFCELQASRDIFYMAKLLEAEQETTAGRSLFKDLWRVPRVRRAAQSSALVMFMQQFCGVNVIAYYSSQIFIDAGFGRKQALLTTMGTGLVNWVFAIPAMYTIDTFGRRNLLLVTLPCMAICLLVTGMAFFIPQEGENDHRRVSVVASAIYLFMAFYSPGEGPVPFTYSAEAFPLYIRDFGMSFATAVCWFFKRKELSAGMVSKLRPETKALTLEELDAVFSVSTSKHASYQVKNLIFHLRKYILRQRVEPLPCLYETGKLFPSS
ncbi:hypothetical protein MJO28_015272 [Puccinia striiformis f. sp. tritici]|uniref:Uncharacterized protein n=1 Tax=Puccinia striiformis f. sp. tritici TaxID=168172 RepID=A0ACC0DSA4_9BASI|nr:hypothetical protein MJO28_015272 [Puccinia striiformis f. sp. tritici]